MIQIKTRRLIWSRTQKLKMYQFLLLWQKNLPITEHAILVLHFQTRWVKNQQKCLSCEGRFQFQLTLLQKLLLNTHSRVIVSIHNNGTNYLATTVPENHHPIVSIDVQNHSTLLHLQCHNKANNFQSNVFANGAWVKPTDFGGLSLERWVWVLKVQQYHPIIWSILSECATTVTILCMENFCPCNPTVFFQLLWPVRLLGKWSEALSWIFWIYSHVHLALPTILPMMVGYCTLKVMGPWEEHMGR